MPEGFPRPSEVTEEEISALNLLVERVHGPVVGAYTVNRVHNGDHPEEIKEAWSGVRLPVRQFSNVGMKYGSEYVFVDAAEAYNALVANGTSKSVLRYWMDTLPENPESLLGFLLADGSYEHFYLEEDQQTDSIPF